MPVIYWSVCLISFEVVPQHFSPNTEPTQAAHLGPRTPCLEKLPRQRLWSRKYGNSGTVPGTTVYGNTWYIIHTAVPLPAESFYRPFIAFVQG